MTNTENTADKVTRYSSMHGRLDDAVDMIRMHASDKPLDALAYAWAAAAELEWIKRALIADAMAAGASWSDIGQQLATTKQAAWQKYHETF
jgi:uncharacterized NAD(P)/FAD-binding protein YdhS